MVLRTECWCVGSAAVDCCFHTATLTATVESRPHAHAHHFLVVFGFVGLGDLPTVGGVDAAPAPAADVARVLARTHLGMAAAERGDLFLKLDHRDRPILSAAGGANLNGTGWNRSGVELVSYGWPVHRGYGAQSHHQQQRVQSGSHRLCRRGASPRIVANHRLHATPLPLRAFGTVP